MLNNSINVSDYLDIVVTNFVCVCYKLLLLH